MTGFEETGFTENEITLLREFYFCCFQTKLEHETRTPAWSLSYWTYEVLEHLILGEEEYKKATMPPWLLSMPKYRAQSGYLNYGRCKRAMFKKLKEIKDLADNLLVCESGYGVDVVVAMMVKDWNEIRCYDNNPGLKDFIDEFFVEKRGVNVKFDYSTSATFRFDEIKESTIVISNNTHISVGEHSERIRNNEKLIYMRDGTVIDRNKMPETVEECRKNFGRGYF